VAVLDARRLAPELGIIGANIIGRDEEGRRRSRAMLTGKSCLVGSASHAGLCGAS
jgi:hypothetical protein